MSREIKFRVWHKNEKRWLDPWAEEDPVLSLKDSGEGCEVFIYERDSGDWSNQNCLMKDVVIQQYTGLKDKNGCEIYEGDIVQHFAFSDGDLFTVKWDHGSGSWSGHGVFGEWVRCKVQGNINENPELLER